VHHFFVSFHGAVSFCHKYIFDVICKLSRHS
jgi:hypothetical protein